MSVRDQNNQPWWQEPLMWLVVGLPLSVVLACVITAMFILQSPNTMVTEPHIKQGLTVERPTAKP
jgi:hypothetical protein